MRSGAKVVLLLVAEAFGSSIHTWQPWEHMKHLWQWMHGDGHRQHFLHHEAAPWTKAHVAGREALGEEFEMRGESRHRRTVPKVDFSNFSLDFFEPGPSTCQNENLFLENIILQAPFSEDCPLQSVTQQGDGPKQILGRRFEATEPRGTSHFYTYSIYRNFLPRLNKVQADDR
eukprot:Skav224714  [mRNA]  locus=scaffold699:361029:362639:+ [translate_table: standard]